MNGPAGELLIALLAGPGGGLVMISGPFDADANNQMRAAFPQFRDSAERPWPNCSSALRILVPNVDAHYRRAVDEGAVIVAEPRDQPWGLRDYECVDLERRQWNFSEQR